MFTWRLFGGTPTTSSPRSRMSPASGSSNPATIRIVVVLPQPDGPSSVRNSPSRMSIERSSTAVTSPKRFVTPRMLIAGVVSLIGGVILSRRRREPYSSAAMPGLGLEATLRDEPTDLRGHDDDHGDDEDHDGHRDHRRQPLGQPQLRVQVDGERRLVAGDERRDHELVERDRERDQERARSARARATGT